MQHWEQLYQLDKLHRQECEVRAQKARQARQLPSSNRKPGLYRMTLAQVGKVLSTLGHTLQARYGAPEISELHDDNVHYQSDYRRRAA
jgi:hypothetical protein